MTQERFEHAPMVESWLKEPVWLPDSDTERIGQLVHQTAQQRHALPKIGRIQPMFTAPRVVVGAMAVALVSGAALSGLLPTGPDEHAAPAATSTESAPASVVTTDAAPFPTTPLFTLPSELPSGSRQGVIETPLGPLSWVHVSEPEIAGPVTGQSLPDFLQVERWDDGIAVWSDTELWATSDGVRWELVPTPRIATRIARSGGSGILSVVGDEAMIVAPNATTAWARVPGGETWDELDSTSIEKALPGRGWAGPNAGDEAPTMRTYRAAEVDGRPVFAIQSSYDLPKKALGIEIRQETQKLKRLSERRYALCGDGSCADGGAKATMKLRFSEGDDELVVKDDRTGKVLGAIAGADLSELFEGRDASIEQAFTHEGGAVVPIDPPGGVHIRNPGDDLVAPPESLTPRDARGLLYSSNHWLWLLPDDSEDDPNGGSVVAWVGDEWVPMDELEIPTGGTWLSHGRVDDLVVIATGGEDHSDLWLLTLPEGA